jgi:hypothetical protein
LGTTDETPLALRAGNQEVVKISPATRGVEIDICKRAPPPHPPHPPLLFDDVLNIYGSVKVKNFLSTTFLGVEDITNDSLTLATLRMDLRDNLNIRSDFNIGINTKNPQTKLDVDGDVHVSGRFTTGLSGKSAGAITFYPPDGYAWFHIDNGPTGRPTGRLRLSYGGNPGDYEIMSLLQNGNVGIGVTNPETKLDVNGNVKVTGDVLIAGADCAEHFSVSEADTVEPGTVMVIDEHSTLKQCQEEYDKRVAGVISGAGGFQSGIILDTHESQDHRMPLALVGKVYCKVDAERSPVGIGDLLTSSSTPGHAMKADDPLKAFGAIVGKALAPLYEGRGLIPILVALQ